MGVRIVALIFPLVLGVLAATSPARAESATCSAPGGSTYRVSWNVENSSSGPLARISGLHRQQGTRWIDQGASAWQLRWELTPPELLGIVGAFKEKTGPLSTLAANPVGTNLSPNVVVPDGSCVVYMYPFALATGPKVAVVGDSLTESLRDATYNQTWIQGYVQGTLATTGRRAEVEGQGGRRWSPGEGLAGLAKADSYLLDELRGLRTTTGGLQTIVVALGANDAGWVAFGDTATERQRRLDYVLARMNEIVNELQTYGVCTVVVTTVDNLANYFGANPWFYAAAAQSINNWLRTRAGASSTDWLRLEDWAVQSANHHTWNAENWFLSDDLHLNDIGRLMYTVALAHAGTAC